MNSYILFQNHVTQKITQWAKSAKKKNSMKEFVFVKFGTQNTMPKIVKNTLLQIGFWAILPTLDVEHILRNMPTHFMCQYRECPT